jgi:hypothetical protein
MIWYIAFISALLVHAARSEPDLHEIRRAIYGPLEAERRVLPAFDYTHFSLIGTVLQ